MTNESESSSEARFEAWASMNFSTRNSLTDVKNAWNAQEAFWSKRYEEFENKVKFLSENHWLEGKQIEFLEAKVTLTEKVVEAARKYMMGEERQWFDQLFSRIKEYDALKAKENK